MDDSGIITHSNHLLLEHDDVDEPPWLDDSPGRLERIRRLRRRFHEPSLDDLLPIFEDIEGFPCSINRKEEGTSNAETLFTIGMDLTKLCPATRSEHREMRAEDAWPLLASKGTNEQPLVEQCERVHK